MTSYYITAKLRSKYLLLLAGAASWI